jgi:hypothetical protein
VLRETDDWPCGIFAVLQAHITFTFFRRRNAHLAAFVRDLILWIDDRILPSTHALCTDFDYGARTCDFLLTRDRSLAAHSLEESGYSVSARAVLFHRGQLHFRIRRLTGLNVPAEPFVESCRMTTVALVFLIPNGKMNSTTLQKVASQEFLGFEGKKTGLRVLSMGRPDLIRKWLDPKTEIFVCFWNIHLFVVKTTPGKGHLLKWDCQAGGDPFCCQLMVFNWADRRSCVSPNCSPNFSSRVTIE